MRCADNPQSSAILSIIDGDQTSDWIRASIRSMMPRSRSVRFSSGRRLLRAAQNAVLWAVSRTDVAADAHRAAREMGEGSGCIAFLPDIVAHQLSRCIRVGAVAVSRPPCSVPRLNLGWIAGGHAPRAGRSAAFVI